LGGRGLGPFDDDPSPLNRIIERRVIKSSDHVITDSEFSKRQAVTELGVSPENISVVHNGVDPKYVPTERRADLARSGGSRESECS